MTRAKPIDRTPDIVERYHRDAVFHAAADALRESRMSESEMRDAVRMAVELEGWSLTDRMRAQGRAVDGLDSRIDQASGLSAMDDVSAAETAALVHIPSLWAVRCDTEKREALRQWLIILRVERRGVLRFSDGVAK